MKVSHAPNPMLLAAAYFLAINSLVSLVACGGDDPAPSGTGGSGAQSGSGGSVSQAGGGSSMGGAGGGGSSMGGSQAGNSSAGSGQGGGGETPNACDVFDAADAESVAGEALPDVLTNLEPLIDQNCCHYSKDAFPVTSAQLCISSRTDIFDATKELAGTDYESIANLGLDAFWLEDVHLLYVKTSQYVLLCSFLGGDDAQRKSKAIEVAQASLEDL